MDKTAITLEFDLEFVIGHAKLKRKRVRKLIHLKTVVEDFSPGDSVYKAAFAAGFEVVRDAVEDMGLASIDEAYGLVIGIEGVKVVVDVP